MMFELKPITRAGIPVALAKAERYRLLNDPFAAESICLDLLEVEPANQDALVMLLLARSDQLAEVGGLGVARAREVLPRLTDSSRRFYYAGVIAERHGKALLRSGRPGSGQMAWAALREAMEWYEDAISQASAGNEEARLRWNTCARILNDHPNLSPRGNEEYQPALEE
jgi:hypothetical protein